MSKIYFYSSDLDNELACRGGEDVIVEDAEGEEVAADDKKNLNDDEMTEKEHEESLKKIISTGAGSGKKKLKDPETNIEIDESLFDGADLADIDDELENLELEDE